MNVFGIGTEIIECVRIAKMIERHGELFLERVYTPQEVEFCSQQASSIQHYAARWAAKEAAVKALAARPRRLLWSQIEVRSEPGIGPTLRLHGAAARRAAQCRVHDLRVSLGSCRTHATAVVLALHEP